MTFGERLMTFIEFKRTNIRSFEIASGLNNGTVYRVVKNGTSLNGDSIAAIGRQWDDLDLNWLILGVGEMLKTALPEIKKQSSPRKDSNIEAQLNRADQQIELQNDMISLLKGIIEEQKKAANQD